MKKFTVILVLILSACSKRNDAGGGVVVGNGLSGNPGQEFYSTVWNMGFEYSDDFVLEKRDGLVIIDNRHSKKAGEQLSSLIFTPINTGARQVRNRRELRDFATDTENRPFDNLRFQIAGGTGVIHESQFQYENGETGKIVYFYFLSSDFKVFKARLQEPTKSNGVEDFALQGIIRSVHYGTGSNSPNLQHYAESEDEDPEA